jgi:DUF4097 and DUF4098 domain-containing protein YvlB
MDPVIHVAPEHIPQRFRIKLTRGVSTMRVLVAIAAAAALCGCSIDFGPSDKFRSDFHYTYEVQPGPRIDAEGFNGEIDITGWDANKVEISGTKFGSSEELRDAIKINVTHGPSSIDIRASRPSDLSGNCGVRFTLHVPRSAIIDRVVSSNGHINVRDVGSAPHLKTSNGAINVDHVAGDVNAETSNGRIRADSIGGAFDASTSNGGITADLDKAPPSAMRLTTSNGSIELTLRTPPRADIHAETNNSAITVSLPANVGAHLTADTSNGSISSDFSLSSSGDEEKHHLDGSIGSGGPTIDLKTSNGSIHIRKGTGA